MALSSFPECIPDDDILQIYHAENIETFQKEGNHIKHTFIITQIS